MKISNTGIELIKSYEKLILKAYQDSGGVLTIGYGHTKDVCVKDVITEQQAEILLKEDLTKAERYLNSLNIDFNQNQYDSIISLVFNIGIGAFGSSTMLKLIKVDPNNLDIASEFVRWIKAGGVPLLGLLRRRIDESKLYFK